MFIDKNFAKRIIKIEGKELEIYMKDKDFIDFCIFITKLKLKEIL